MKNKKVIVAFALLPLFILLIGWGKPWMLLALMGVALVIGTWEYTKITFGEKAWFAYFITLLPTLGLAALTAYFPASYALAGTAGAFIFASLAFMWREKEPADILPNVSKAFFGIVLLGLLGGMIVALKVMETQVGGFKLVMLLFALIWANDAGAYFVGSAFGKHKLAPVISPNKTIEGSLGGFAATMILAMIVSLLWGLLSAMDGLLLGLMMGIVGPLGDLFESALKRGAGVKDSGKLLPGHGGILDRVDSVLFGAPILYFFVLFKILQ